MKAIKQFLLDNNYDFYELDNIIEGNNEFLHIMVIKLDDGYLVRNAIKCYFDRWANSGNEFHIETEEDVIKYFSDNTKCLTDAISELVETIVEDCGFKRDNTNISKTINFMYDMIEGEN